MKIYIRLCYCHAKNPTIGIPSHWEGNPKLLQTLHDLGPGQDSDLIPYLLSPCSPAPATQVSDTASSFHLRGFIFAIPSTRVLIFIWLASLIPSGFCLHIIYSEKLLCSEGLFLTTSSIPPSLHSALFFLLALITIWNTFACWLVWLIFCSTPHH